MKKELVPNMLREHRVEAGLRQIDIADRLQLDCSDRISHWENGQSIPSMVNLFKLAKVYGVLPHELYPELWKGKENNSATHSHEPISEV